MDRLRLISILADCHSPIFLEFGILYDSSKDYVKASYRQFLVICYVILAVFISIYKIMVCGT